MSSSPLGSSRRQSPVTRKSAEAPARSRRETARTGMEVEEVDMVSASQLAAGFTDKTSANAKHRESTLSVEAPATDAPVLPVPRPFVNEVGLRF